MISSLVDRHYRFESTPCFHFQGLRLLLPYMVPVVSPGTLATLYHTVPYRVSKTVFLIFTCLRSTNSKSLFLLSVSGLNIYPNNIERLAYRIQDDLTENINIIQLDLWMDRKGKILMCWDYRSTHISHTSGCSGLSRELSCIYKLKLNDERNCQHGDASGTYLLRHTHTHTIT